MKEHPIPNRIFCDFDNTISDTQFNPETGRYDMGEVLPGMKEAVNNCSKSHEIIIFTSRPIKEWKDVTRYLAEHGVIFDGIMEKPLGIAYVDDRALRPEEFIKQQLKDSQDRSIHDEEVNYARKHYAEVPDDGTWDSDGNRF